MKKIAFVLALSLLLACFLPLTASASVFRSLRSVLDEKSEECRVLLADSSLYQPYRKNIQDEYKVLTSSMVDHEFILEFYLSNYMATAHLSLEERIADRSRGARYFLSFGDEIRLIRRHKNEDGETVISWIESYEWGKLCPSWIKDVFWGSETQTICGVKCKILDVICFSASIPNETDSVYYVTDQGVFVRDYWYTRREYELTLADYQRYSLGRWNSYLEAVAISKDPMAGLSSLPAYAYRHGDISDFHEMQVTHYMPARLILHGSICALIAAGGVTTVVLLGRRKRKAKSEMND